MPPLMSEADLDLARDLMVDGQLRPSQVTDRRILDAMRRLKREDYGPEHARPLAYIDEDLPLGFGRFLLKPLVMARLLQLAAPRAGEHVLVVGAEALYGAAIIAACGAHVTALEEEEGLTARAQPVENVTLVHGKLADGYAAAGPYDLIVIEGAAAAIPPAISAQVAAHGRLVTLLREGGNPPVAILAEPTEGGLRLRTAFNAAGPLLPGLSPRRSFTF